MTVREVCSTCKSEKDCNCELLVGLYTVLIILVIGIIFVGLGWCIFT